VGPWMLQVASMPVQGWLDSIRICSPAGDAFKKFHGLVSMLVAHTLHLSQ
jgi:hypothetical protein